MAQKVESKNGNGKGKDVSLVMPEFKLAEPIQSAIAEMVKDLIAYDGVAANLKDARQVMAVHMAKVFDDKTDFAMYHAGRKYWEEQYRAARKCDEVASNKAFERALKMMNEYLADTNSEQFKIPRQNTPEAMRKDKEREAEKARVTALARKPHEELVEMVKVGNSEAIKALAMKQSDDKKAEDGAVKSKRDAVKKGLADCLNPGALDCMSLVLQAPDKVDALFRALRIVGIERQVGTLHAELIADAIDQIAKLGNQETARKVHAIADTIRAKAQHKAPGKAAAKAPKAKAPAIPPTDGEKAPQQQPQG